MLKGDDEIDLLAVLDSTRSEYSAYVDNTDTAKLHIVLDEGRGCAHNGCGVGFFDLHGVVRNESVTSLYQLHSRLALSDAAVAGDENTLTVDLDENAVTGDPWGKPVAEHIDKGLHKLRGVHGGAKKGRTELLGYLNGMLGHFKICGYDHGYRLVGQKGSDPLFSVGAVYLLKVKIFNLSDDLDALRLEMIVKSRKGKTGAVYVTAGDVYFAVGHIQNFQLEKVNDVFERYCVH